MAMYNIDPWYNWTAGMTTTSSAVTTLNTWNIWVENVGTTAATSPSITWNQWNQSTAITSNLNVWNQWIQTPNGYYNPYQPHQLTAEEQVARDERLERLRLEQQERTRNEREARERAKALLLDHLSPVQQLEYERRGEFKVEVGHRTFVIGRGTHGNVREIHVQDGHEVILRSFCIPARNGTIPEPDVHLAQKLMLEGGEDSLQEFHRIANITTYAAALPLDRVAA